jgi:four helix bundle protein
MASSFKDLRVWQDAMKLATDTYQATADFPKPELYGLSQQMRRAAVSVPSNIAEGKGRGSDKGFLNFLFNARGSLMELETQIDIAQSLQYMNEESAEQLRGQATKVGKSLSGLINALTKQPRAGQADDRRPTTDDQYV